MSKNNLHVTVVRRSGTNNSPLYVYRGQQTRAAECSLCDRNIRLATNVVAKIISVERNLRLVDGEHEVRTLANGVMEIMRTYECECGFRFADTKVHAGEVLDSWEFRSAVGPRPHHKLKRLVRHLLASSNAGSKQRAAEPFQYGDKRHSEASHDPFEYSPIAPDDPSYDEELYRRLDASLIHVSDGNGYAADDARSLRNKLDQRDSYGKDGERSFFRNLRSRRHETVATKSRGGDERELVRFYGRFGRRQDPRHSGR